MSIGEMQPQATETPKTHTLRVAIFDFYNQELVSRYGSSPLIHDVQEISDNGLLGISHERRATLVTGRQHFGHLALKLIGKRFSVEDYEGTTHDAYAMQTLGPVPFTFYRKAMYMGIGARRRSIDEVYEQVNESIGIHQLADLSSLSDSEINNYKRDLELIDSKLDPIDALVLDEARNMQTNTRLNLNKLA